MQGTSLAEKDAGDTMAMNDDDRKCKCPMRMRPPEPPSTLPMAATEENVPKLKKWIIERYASSAFNTCTHQFLPLVESSLLLRLLVDPTVTPKAVHKPVQAQFMLLMRSRLVWRRMPGLVSKRVSLRTLQQHGVAGCVWLLRRMGC